MKILAIVLAVVFFVAAGMYATGNLQFGASHPGRHLTHAVAAFVLGLVSLVWLRFQANQTAQVR